ncbi:MAG TPA: carboxypeptidase-like regulatory domain-containing protein [Acidobacteriaceae bacterium]|nr:carboxypeptidase-like regulatory domain-containing protein [Acidobacteriaceae bacterium]
MKRAVRQFVLVTTVLAAFGAVSSSASAAPAASSAITIGSIAGAVSNAAGLPQSGIMVELLYADSTLAARAFTDSRGNYRFAAVITGQYSLKAIGANYIPTLKQNLRVRANTIVNLTVNSLYDVMQWTPRPRRARPQGQDDDWSWTLRTAEGRPLLRWQEDGSPILVSDGSAETKSSAQRQMRARLKAVAGNRRFGEGETQLSAAAINQRSDRRRLAMSAQAAPDSSGVMDAMLGFRQEMTASGLGSSSIQTVAAVMQDPSVQMGGSQGLQTAALRSWESLQILDSLEAEAGSEQVLARVGNSGTIVAALPFARLTLHRGESALEYSVASARPADSSAGELSPAAWLPMVTTRNGGLAIEHGLHQELGWSTSAGPAEMRLVIYGDSIDNPVLEGSGRLTAGDAASQWLLVDGASGLMRAAGPSYSTTGMLASVESQLPGHNRIKLSYASGDALILHSASTPMRPTDIGAIITDAHTRRAQMYSLALSGTADAIGTRWRASYRWQPGDTVTAVAPFAVDASEPYLNIYIRQPLRLIPASKEGPAGVEIQLDLRNLLAEGYQPFITSDGSQLIFAQAQRCITGGLAFNF